MSGRDRPEPRDLREPAAPGEPGLPADQDEQPAPAGIDEFEEEPPRRPRRRSQSIGQSIGGVLFGFEQQVWRNIPPPHELVHHARSDDPLPAADGGFVTFELPAPSGGEDERTAGDELPLSHEAEPDGQHEGAGDRGAEVGEIRVADGDVDPDGGPEPDPAG
jgi:hypothetical protein